MQCNHCYSPIKKQYFICPSCLHQTISEKQKQFDQTYYHAEQLKLQLEKSLPLQQSLQERKLRLSKQRIQLLKEYIKQLKQENHNLLKKNEKLYQEQSQKKEVLQLSLDQLKNLIQLHKENIKKIKNFENLENFKDKIYKIRKRSCLTLFQSFPFYTDKGKLNLIFEDFKNKLMIVNIFVNDNSKYLFFLNFNLPIYLINENFNFIDILLKFNHLDYNLQNNILQFDNWPSNEKLSNIFGYIILLLQQLEIILKIKLPNKMIYRGNHSLILENIGNDKIFKTIKKENDVTNDGLNMLMPKINTNLAKVMTVEPKYKYYPLFDGDLNSVLNEMNINNNSSNRANTIANDQIGSLSSLNNNNNGSTINSPRMRYGSNLNSSTEKLILNSSSVMMATTTTSIPNNNVIVTNNDYTRSPNNFNSAPTPTPETIILDGNMDVHHQQQEVMSPKEQFVKGVRLLNENILALCHLQGIMVSKANECNLFHNLLILYFYENIGCEGPFHYYPISTMSLKKKNLQEENNNNSTNVELDNNAFSQFDFMKGNINENYYIDKETGIVKKIIVNKSAVVDQLKKVSYKKKNSLLSNVIKENYLEDSILM
ncbi:hypothetical protein ABK040_006285 [Willaertia magna]